MLNCFNDSRNTRCIIKIHVISLDGITPEGLVGEIERISGRISSNGNRAGVDTRSNNQINRRCGISLSVGNGYVNIFYLCVVVIRSKTKNQGNSRLVIGLNFGQI